MDHSTRAGLAQTDVAATTNEITGFQPLLEGLDLTGQVVTAGAMHTQHAHADWLVTHKRAASVLIVKASSHPAPPATTPALARGPRRRPPPRRGHHRVEIRRPQVTNVTDLGYPHATQAIRITRRVRPLTGRKWWTVTTYAVTSLTAAQASPARLADWMRGHLGIQALHHIRDTTFAEDA